MKKDLKTALYLLLIPAIPMLTTLLLDLAFIQKHTVRQILIYALMLIQFIALTLMFLHYLKKN